MEKEKIMFCMNIWFCSVLILISLQNVKVGFHIILKASKMKLLFGILFVSSIPHLCMNQDPKMSQHLAVVELVSGKSRVFSGESVRLKCSVPSDMESTWRYVWFKGNVKLQQTEQYEIWSATIQQSDKYSCQGVRETHRGAIHTIQSLPMEIYVEGGWVLLHGPSEPPLVGGTMTLTCRVRGNPHLEGVILYKDGLEVMTQTGPSPRLLLVNVAINDQGSYWCRATWDIQKLSHSAMSTPIGVSILEVLTKPSLLMDNSSPKIPVNMMRLICLLQFNAPAPDVLINYYFYKDNMILGLSTSNNNMVVSREPGWYKCKAKVPMLGLVEWSNRTSFGRVEESHHAPAILHLMTSAAAKPTPIPTHDLRVQLSSSPPNPRLLLGPPTDSQPSLETPHPTEVLSQYTEGQSIINSLISQQARGTTEPMQLPLKSSEPATNTPLSDQTTLPNNQVTIAALFEMSGDRPDPLDSVSSLE